ncbi:glycosyltransferase [Muricoccus radiodurans]|uniref:glycosyltransferase n=1 Tax=Muricoccus radiodurans TaxID=2231721 RepID=UPI003CEF922D
MAGAAMGGAETFYERLCLALHGAGETVLPVIRENSDRAARLRAGGLEPVELGFGGPLDLLTGWRLGGTLRRFGPDVTIAWMNRGARFSRRGPWVLVGRLGGYYDLRHYRRCDHLVANTRDLVRWIVSQGWDAARVHHLPNFAPDLGGAAPVTDLPAPPGFARLLAMGRLHRNKGFDTLLRALPHLPRTQLWLAGEGPERGALEALAAQLGVADRVAFLGWRGDQGALLAACDLSICPSRHEPLGNVVLEAFSASRPVVAAASHGPVELIAHGETGLIVPVDEPEALARAVAGLIADPARAAALAEAGRLTYERDFAEAPVVARWRALLPTLRRRDGRT